MFYITANKNTALDMNETSLESYLVPTFTFINYNQISVSYININLEISKFSNIIYGNGFQKSDDGSIFGGMVSHIEEFQEEKISYKLSGINLAIDKIIDNIGLGNEFFKIFSDDGSTINGSDLDDILNGHDGYDILNGGEGSDYLDGGLGFDYAQYSYAKSGLIVDIQFTENNTGEATGDSYADVEGLYGSAFSDSLRGDAGDNWLWGNGGNDYLFGRDGNDTLVGAEDSDTLFGEAEIDTLYGNNGHDFLYGGTAGDYLNGGDGFDYAGYVYDNEGITADLLYNVQNIGGASGDHYNSIEGLLGSIFDDSLRGDAGGNWLVGNGGNDSLYGRDGDDTLVGGAGNDYLIGDSGNDTFVFNRGDGNDVIYDFAAGNGSGDVLQLSKTLGVSSYAEVQQHAQQIGNDTFITFDDGSSIILINMIRWSLAIDDFSFI